MNAESFARDLWSRDIKNTNDLGEYGRNAITSNLGENGLSEVNQVLATNWNKWTQDMIEFFGKQ